MTNSTTDEAQGYTRILSKKAKKDCDNESHKNSYHEENYLEDNKHNELFTEISEKVISFQEIDQPIQVFVSIPEAFAVTNILDIEQAFKKISELTPIALELANAAFVKKDKSTWDIAQRSMYYWNYRDLTRVDRIQDYTSLVENALRKIFLEIEIKNSPNYQLECMEEFTPERAVQELADKVFSHRINKHPLLEEMASHGISLNCLKKFLENYYVNNRVFHLFIVALSLCSPLARRTELANNFYDELGGGDSLMAHPVLFLKNFNSIGKPSFISPLPESLHLVNAKTFAAFLSGDFHYGMGSFGYIELAMPGQMRKILSGLEKSGLPKSDLEFWETHITIDVEHGKTWFSEMHHLIETAEQAQKCLVGGMRLLNARAAMYDGIWSCYAE
jgi:Iron-containing redox enzyme